MSYPFTQVNIYINMHTKKNNKLPDFDYSNSTYYFVTICVHELEELFGHVDQMMHLNEHGIIVEYAWKNLIYHFDVRLDEFIVMPNHFHGIIILEDTNDQSLFTIIESFKASAAHEIKKSLSSFEWQKSFSDWVIRDGNELYKVRKYIQENPIKWETEKRQS